MNAWYGEGGCMWGWDEIWGKNLSIKGLNDMMNRRGKIYISSTSIFYIFQLLFSLFPIQEIPADFEYLRKSWMRDIRTINQMEKMGGDTGIRI